MSELKKIDRLNASIKEAFDDLNEINRYGTMDYADYTTLYNAIDRIDDAADSLSASPWRRVEEPPKDACDCFVCWTTIHDAETGEVTGHGFWCEKGWYEDGLLGEAGFYCQSRKETHPVRVEPDYWMPIEPPKEEK